MEQSQQVLEWQAEAEKRGVARGKAEGKAEGQAEGKADGKADSVLWLLERRFSRPPPAVLAAAIAGTTDLARLDHLLDLAMDANSLEEFRRAAQL
jgi:flagellar biosynthesis/type III secretory pathway protein FliH